MEIAGKKISLFWTLMAVLVIWWGYRRLTNWSHSVGAAKVTASSFFNLSDADVYKLRQVSYVDEDGYMSGGTLYDAFYQLAKSGRDTTLALNQINTTLQY
jgi:hypothetical protein